MLLPGRLFQVDRLIKIFIVAHLLSPLGFAVSCKPSQACSTVFTYHADADFCRPVLCVYQAPAARLLYRCLCDAVFGGIAITLRGMGLLPAIC
jgi:hypothetical protein